MVNPTNLESRRFAPRAGQDVWAFPGPPGYLESIQAAGSVAAPLLAGASFTLVALVLQSTAPFGRWQDMALLLLVAAGLAQVFAVQSVIWTRRYMVTPDELRQWFPEDFTQSGEHPTRWLLNVQATNDQHARKWANRTRILINAGISLLLAGIAVGVVPPHGHISPVRWAAIAVAWTGVAVEASWVMAAAVDESARRRLLLRLAAIFTSGGATAAAGFAAAAGTSGGALAIGWSIALAVAAMTFWLAAHTDARFSRGRLRLYAPSAGPWGTAQAVLAPLAPAVLVMALGSAVRTLVQDRHAVLSDLHPGVGDLLPEGVSLGAHHKAWSRCTALLADEGEAARLLRESAQRLGQHGQPHLDELRKRLARVPGCVVKVIDRDDARTEFGYFIVYPLLAETVRRIKSGHVASGRQLRPNDLAESGDLAAGWYISVVWAPGPKWTRKCVIATLLDALAASGAGTAPRPVFARPATDQGRLIMGRYGFTPVDPQADGIWALQK